MKRFFTLLTAAAFATTSLLSAGVSAETDTSLGGAATFLQDKYELQDATDDFKQVNVKKNETGCKLVKLQQVVDGLPVYGSDYVVLFDQQGNVDFENGNYDTKASDFKVNRNFIDEKEAIEAAKSGAGFTSAAGDDLYQPDEIKAKMYLYCCEGEYMPVYLVRVNWFHADSFGDWRVFVNANDGKVVDKYNAIAYQKAAKVTGSSEQGTGTGVLGDTKPINLTLSNGTYYLQDSTKPMSGTISTYSADNKTRLPGKIVTDEDNTFDAKEQRAAVDANYYAGVTYDFYKNLGRDSIDNRGMDIKSTVHYKQGYVNAMWNGKQMVYGDGDGVQALELSGGLDIVAHELTHGVTSYSADLEYRNQSGALNESFSDVFGALVEFKAQPEKADWLMGEDIWTPGTEGDALRSMQDPTIYGDPDHMSKYLNTTEDNGGVHTNSSIPNKAAYLIGSQIGVEKMAKIYYRALTDYLTTTSDFSDCKAALLRAATDFYGADSAEYNTVSSAFDAVGIQ